MIPTSLDDLIAFYEKHFAGDQDVQRIDTSSPESHTWTRHDGSEVVTILDAGETVTVNPGQLLRWWGPTLAVRVGPSHWRTTDDHRQPHPGPDSFTTRALTRSG